MLRELGWPLTEAEVIERFVGRSEREMHGAIEAHLGEQLPAGWQARFEAGYKKAFADGLSPAGRLQGPNTIVFEDMSELSELLKQLALA